MLVAAMLGFAAGIWGGVFGEYLYRITMKKMLNKKMKEYLVKRGKLQNDSSEERETP